MLRTIKEKLAGKKFGGRYERISSSRVLERPILLIRHSFREQAAKLRESSHRLYKVRRGDPFCRRQRAAPCRLIRLGSI